jgi:hypothetical protein
MHCCVFFLCPVLSVCLWIVHCWHFLRFSPMFFFMNLQCQLNYISNALYQVKYTFMFIFLHFIGNIVILRIGCQIIVIVVMYMIFYMQGHVKEIL